jgi:hypothetical protein
MISSLGGRRILGAALIFAAVVLRLLMVSPCAVASSAWWRLSSGARPSVLEAGGKGEIAAYVENVGNASASGANDAIRVVDELPAGLHATRAAAALPFSNKRPAIPCTLEASRVECVLKGALVSYGEIELRVSVNVSGEASASEVNRVRVTGGETPDAEADHDIVVSEEPEPAVPFGIQTYQLVNEEEGGGEDTQAGAHPFQQTTTIELNQGPDKNPVNVTPNVEVAALPKDLRFKWPAGLIGNPTATPRCGIVEFLAHVGESENGCPSASAVGVATVTANEPRVFEVAVFTVPLYNLEPGVGEPARLGFNIVEANAPVYIDTALRTGGDYGVTVISNNITQTAALLSANVTVWGVPGAQSHDDARGWGCLLKARGIETSTPCNASEQASTPPFLSLPTQCGTKLESTVEGDAWRSAGEYVPLASYVLPPLNGCNQLRFQPTVGMVTDKRETSSPIGLKVDVHVPQEEDENPEGLASAAIRDISVALPEGFTVNPAAASGLLGCTESEIGYLRPESHPPSELYFTPTLSQPSCPEEAKIATVKVTTPLLTNPLEGYVYLAAPQNFAGAPQENPFESLIALYLVAEDPVSRSLVKLPGKITLNPETGQVSTTFEDTPEVSFEDAEIDFFTGSKAALAAPDQCGQYPSKALLTPWSGTPPVESDATLPIDHGLAGGPCPGSLPFTPHLAAGSTQLNAGAFTPFNATIIRADGEQTIRNVNITTPPGMSGILKGVALCPTPQADTGTCSSASLIGHATANVGVGNSPYVVEGGQVFLTEGYGGAPFGLSVVTPAVAGPFNLGNIVVRAKITVNPTTAAITVATDENGPHAIPRILDGIPIALRQISVTIDRPGFTFNPTDCTPLSVTGSVASFSGTLAAVVTPFEVANCAVLQFAPKLTVTTSAKSSRANGTSFTTTLRYPKAAFGSQANIARVKVDLPKQLPSRQSTLKDACRSQIFEANPANCGPASIIGSAKVTTPLLPVPLTGPAYFVSHGNESFPSLTMVLQGYGITVDLVGSTFIKKGVTSTTFKTVPDVPFETFTLTLPKGPHSALGVYGNLCAHALSMPTEFLAQNGATIHQATPVNVESCPKTLTITSQSKHNGHLYLNIYAPGPGHITITGQHIKPTTTQTHTHGTLTLPVQYKTPAHQATSTVHVTYTPHTGHPQTRTTQPKPN